MALIAGLAAAAVVRPPHAALISNDSYLYGDIAKNSWLDVVYGLTETGDTPGSLCDPPDSLARLPSLSGGVLSPLRHGALPRGDVHAGGRGPVCLLAAARRGTALLRSRGAGGAVAGGPVSVYCQLHGHADDRDPGSASIALAVYGFLRWQSAGLGFNRWLWVVALALAYSILLRPEQGLLAAAVLPAMLWRGCGSLESTGPCQSKDNTLRAGLPVLVAGLCVVLPLLPWTIRNWGTFHVFEPLVPHYANDPGEIPPTGFDRWYRTWGIEFSSTEEVYWNYDGDVIARTKDMPAARAFDSPEQYARTAALVNDYDRTTRETAAARHAQVAALARVLWRPIRCGTTWRCRWRGL